MPDVLDLPELPAVAEFAGRGPLRWPLQSFMEGVRRVRERWPKRVLGDYSFQLIRFWYVKCLIERDLEERPRPCRIVDMGSERGMTRVFCGGVKGATWTGLDLRQRKIDATLGMYDELIQSDFDTPLPLADNSADFAVFLHVIEHLPRPGFTLGEIARVLKPGGLLVAASPVLPMPLALIREAQFRAQFRRGTRQPGSHVRVFWPRRWKASLRRAGLEPELVRGGYLTRWASSPLENLRWWVRLNQAWGAVAPFFGNEVLVAARKPV